MPQILTPSTTAPAHLCRWVARELRFDCRRRGVVPIGTRGWRYCRRHAAELQSVLRAHPYAACECLGCRPPS